MNKRLTKKEKLLRKRQRHKLSKVYLKKQQKKEFYEKLKVWRQKIIERDNYSCQKCCEDLNKIDAEGFSSQKDVHHVISLSSCKKNYPDLLFDINNGLLLCPRCHKIAPDSAHQSPIEFAIWFKTFRPVQYNYLVNFIMRRSYNGTNKS